MPREWLEDWLAYDEISPIGASRLDANTGHLIQTMYAANGAKPVPEIEECILKFGPREDDGDDEDDFDEWFESGEWIELGTYGPPASSTDGDRPDDECVRRGEGSGQGRP